MYRFGYKKAGTRHISGRSTPVTVEDYSDVNTMDKRRWHMASAMALPGPDTSLNFKEQYLRKLYHRYCSFVFCSNRKERYLWEACHRYWSLEFVQKLKEQYLRVPFRRCCSFRFSKRSQRAVSEENISQILFFQIITKYKRTVSLMSLQLRYCRDFVGISQVLFFGISNFDQILSINLPRYCSF